MTRNHWIFCVILFYFMVAQYGIGIKTGLEYGLVDTNIVMDELNECVGVLDDAIDLVFEMQGEPIITGGSHSIYQIDESINLFKEENYNDG